MEPGAKKEDALPTLTDRVEALERQLKALDAAVTGLLPPGATWVDVGGESVLFVPFRRKE